MQIEQLQTGHTYTVASEEDLRDDSLYFKEPQEFTSEERQAMGEILSQRIFLMQQARVALIGQYYTPKHAHLYEFNPQAILCPEIQLAFDKNLDSVLSLLHKESPTGIYSFNLFTEQFCKELVEEIEHYEQSGLPASRPNSMNNYGLILDEIGFTPFLNQLRQNYIQPIAQVLYPHEGRDLVSHHGFIVTYKIGEDLDLGFHFDSSDVTLNVCLGKQFTGGSLYFKGLLKDPSTHSEEFEFHHQPGKAILHIGKHRHGANPIHSGERYNLIVWCKQPPQDHECPCCSQCGPH